MKRLISSLTPFVVRRWDRTTLLDSRDVGYAQVMYRGNGVMALEVFDSIRSPQPTKVELLGPEDTIDDVDSAKPGGKIWQLIMEPHRPVPEWDSLPDHCP